MPYTKSQVYSELQFLKRRRSRTEQLHNVISLRINDHEKRELEELTKTTSKSISDIMRDAFKLWRSCSKNTWLNSMS